MYDHFGLPMYFQKLSAHYQLDEVEAVEEWRAVKHVVHVRHSDKKVAEEDKDTSSMMVFLAGHCSVDYPIISYICSALSCVIVSTADCERGFSLLKLIKTPLRNSIGQTNLNHTMHVCINTDGSAKGFDYDSAKKQFLAINPKRRVI